MPMSTSPHAHQTLVMVAFILGNRCLLFLLSQPPNGPNSRSWNTGRILAGSDAMSHARCGHKVRYEWPRALEAVQTLLRPPARPAEGLVPSAAAVGLCGWTLPRAQPGRGFLGSIDWWSPLKTMGCHFGGSKKRNGGAQ